MSEFCKKKVSSQVRKGGERFELLKADAERQLEEANDRLGEVRLKISFINLQKCPNFIVSKSTTFLFAGEEEQSIRIGKVKHNAEESPDACCLS